VKTLPSVISASLTETVPVSLGTTGVTFSTASSGADPSRVTHDAIKNLVGKDYFDTTGIPILQGRGFRTEDETNSSTAVVVSEELKSHLLSSLAELSMQRREEFKLIKGQLDLINDQQTALRIELEYKGDKGTFLKCLKDCFRGSKISQVALSEIADVFSDGADIYKNLDKAKTITGSAATTFEQYFNQHLETLLTSATPNSYAIKYHGRELKHHSIGQRASALILFVLSQRDSDVVIIDQPEDDLDNQTIYDDVIKLIRKLKPNTQFIFATHNPNIPVLGDAEQVVACVYSDESIQPLTGSIDNVELQESIVRIMEGGSEAFQRRKEIYQMWKL
jgi:chromosome segregation protein